MILNNIQSFQMSIDVSFIISILVFRLLTRYVLGCIEKYYNKYILIYYKLLNLMVTTYKLQEVIIHMYHIISVMDLDVNS